MSARRTGLGACAAAIALGVTGLASAANRYDFDAWLVRASRASVPRTVDADAAMRLAHQDRCLRCHAVERSLEGPSFVAVAEKYRGRKDAAEKLVVRLAVGEPVRLSDGRVQEHKAGSAADIAEVRNLVRWILAQ